jgi:riboflavin synthase
MFTGLVEAVGTIKQIQFSNSQRSCQMRVGLPVEVLADAQRGDSIAINGCCLTVTEMSKSWVQFDVSDETLRLTNLGKLAVDARVNVERALPMGKRLGGHLVSGHVDGLAEVRRFDRLPDGSELIVRISRELSRYTIKKGSATIDGISLTINDIKDTLDESELRFTIIPETLAATTLGQLRLPWSCNLEVDMMAKFAERFAERK